MAPGKALYVVEEDVLKYLKLSYCTKITMYPQLFWKKFLKNLSVEIACMYHFTTECYCQNNFMLFEDLQDGVGFHYNSMLYGGDNKEFPSLTIPHDLILLKIGLLIIGTFLQFDCVRRFKS